MGINHASIKNILIKVGEYNKLYKFKINTFENNFVNSNLIKENNKNKSKCK
jgi:hypothetical protein